MRIDVLFIKIFFLVFLVCCICLIVYYLAFSDTNKDIDAEYTPKGGGYQIIEEILFVI